MVSYKKLFKLMIDRDMKKKDLVTKSGIAYSTLGKMAKGENVNVDVLVKICKALDCQIDDIMEILPDEEGVTEK